MSKIELLRDGHGRLIRDVRVSVTDRCNFRCQYCMPAEGLPWLERSEVLTFEEIARIVGLMASMGVHDVRLTGGEPLVRRNFPHLVSLLAALEGVHDLSVTTNGFLLERDADALVAAGVNRFNVSVDSLQRDRFYLLTRRDALDQVQARQLGVADHHQVTPPESDRPAPDDEPVTRPQAGQHARVMDHKAAQRQKHPCRLSQDSG